MAELADMDDWGSAWQDAKDKGESWGGRGKGGRGVKRNTWQPKDVYVEGKQVWRFDVRNYGETGGSSIVLPSFGMSDVTVNERRFVVLAVLG